MRLYRCFQILRSIVVRIYCAQRHTITHTNDNTNVYDFLSLFKCGGMRLTFKLSNWETDSIVSVQNINKGSKHQ